MKNKLLILTSIILLLEIANSFALGVTPGITNIDFESGSQKIISFTVINSENKNLELNMHFEGDLSQYMSSQENSFKISSSQESVSKSVRLNLPDNLSPGLHKSEIVIEQQPTNTDGKTSVSTILAVATQVYVYVPYPGKYPEAELKIMGTEKNKNFVIRTINRGTEKINSLSADIVIFDSEGKQVKKLKTNEVSLNSNEFKEISAEWEVDVETGRYTAKAALSYDKEQKLLEKDFEVGEMVLDLQQISVKDFKLGEVAKFDMIVQNKWNEAIDNAYAEMRIYNKDMMEIDSLKSATYNIPAGMQTTMNYYWDTKDIERDMYNANVILYYLDKKTQQDLKLDVKENSINVIGLGYVISSDNSGSNSSMVRLLLIIIGILILANVLWFLVLRRYLKKRKK